VGFLIILGGLGFTVLVDLFEFGTAKKRINRRFSLHSKLTLYMTGMLILIGFILIFAFEFNNPQTMGNLSGKGKILSSLFHSITPRTAGFNTISMDGATLSTKFLTIILMFIGGAPSSTAGGIKVTTFGVLLFTMASMAGGRDETEIFKRKIPRDIVNRALALVSASLAVVIMGTMLLSFTETGADFMDILFETTSAFGTVGLSLGITPNLSSAGKIIIAFVMFIGRLGPMTLAIAVANRQQKRKKLIKYPEGKVSVG
jgi:trk system potassium uptake protein TrkH